jgi:outer membrane protein OmpA-like peptidoglycan-associated protein
MNFTQRSIALSFLLISSIAAWGQNLGKLKEDALKLFERGKYGESLELLRHYDGLKPGETDIGTAIGISAYHLNKLPMAKEYLTAVATNGKNPTPSVFLYLGQAQHADLNFKEAIKNYKKFLNLADAKHPERRRVVSDVQRCASGIKIVRQSELALVENMGEVVNSRFDEFAPVPSLTVDDRLYFSAAREDAEGGLRNAQCLPDPKNGRYFSDIYFTDLDGNDWRSPTRIDNVLINTPRHEYLMDITNAGKTLIFFRSLNNFSGDILVDTFKSDNEVRSLPPKLKAPILPENGNNTLFFFNDSILIFAARRNDSYGGLDLYYTILSNGIWAEAKNLGRSVNTPFDETCPFLAKDGRTLYFSSNATASMGGFDIFKSVFNEDSLRFMPAQNLGKPINSAGDDMFFRLTTDGMKAYFCSSRKEGFGERDIYTALFKNFQREQNPSSPVAFHMVEAAKQQEEFAQADKPKVQKILEVKLEPLYYETDEDLLRGVNLAQLKTAIATVKQFPNLKVILTAHTTPGEKTSFDLYFAMKRLERIAKYLSENGLTNEQILLKSVGSEYPLAMMRINGVQNPAGEKLNRRVDIMLDDLTLPAAPVKIEYKTPIVSEFMASTAGERLKPHAAGLSYKIQILSSKRLFDNEILGKYGDAMMEASGIEGAFAYSVGLHTKYAEAEKMRTDLLKENMREAVVIPYLNGIRVIGDDARKWVAKYPDLLNYLAARKRP